MASTSRQSDPPLEDVLGREPYLFDFFQAVRLLGLLRPDRTPVGRAAHPGQEVARFAARIGLRFPPSAIHSLKSQGPDAPPEMTVAFLGLTGPSGVLPHAYTELVQERHREGDHAIAAFLDLFNHRLVSLFYRAWEKHAAIVGYEQSRARAGATGRPPVDEGLRRHLLALIGLGLPPLRNRQDLPDSVPLAYANLFARRQRPATTLRALLRDYTGLPVEVEQFRGAWLVLDPADRSRIGRSGASNRLGVDLVAGGRIWDVQGRFRLRVGPLDLDQYRSLLPGGPTFRSISELTRLYVDAELDFDIQLVLKADEVPDCRLSSAPQRGACLGRSAWLRSGPLRRDPDDAVFAAPA